MKLPHYLQSHSQCGEDRWVLENLVLPQRGIYCEVGAFDGDLSSNTYIFEHLGWHGILVEPDPLLAASARAKRLAKVYCCAAGPLGIFDFHINESDRGLSGFNRPGISHPVACFPLRVILDHAGLNNVDLLSIDTEGTELDVWNSIGKIRPPVVIMEHQTCQEPSNEQAIIKRMALDGYTVAHRTTYNLILTRI